MVKPLSERLKFRNVYIGEGKQEKGRRKLIFEWGTNVSIIGEIKKGDDNQWHSTPDNDKCRGWSHIFDPECLRQTGKTMGIVKALLIVALEKSENETRRRNAKPVTPQKLAKKTQIFFPEKTLDK